MPDFTALEIKTQDLDATAHLFDDCVETLFFSAEDDVFYSTVNPDEIGTTGEALTLEGILIEGDDGWTRRFDREACAKLLGIAHVCEIERHQTEIHNGW